jgi:hypothetical protein
LINAAAPPYSGHKNQRRRASMLLYPADNPAGCKIRNLLLADGKKCAFWQYDNNQYVTHVPPVKPAKNQHLYGQIK